MISQDVNGPELLRWQFGMTRSLLDRRLSGLTTDECLVELGSPCWTVRQSDGIWRADFADPEPTDPTAVTLGWLTWHLGWWLSETDAALGGRPHGVPTDVAWPGSADAALAWLGTLLDRWADRLDEWDEEDLDASGPPWPWSESRPRGYLAAWVNAELMKNTAEISLLRTLVTTASRNA